MLEFFVFFNIAAWVGGILLVLIWMIVPFLLLARLKSIDKSLQKLAER